MYVDFCFYTLFRRLLGTCRSRPLWGAMCGRWFVCYKVIAAYGALHGIVKKEGVFHVFLILSPRPENTASLCFQARPSLKKKRGVRCTVHVATSFSPTLMCCEIASCLAEAMNKDMLHKGANATDGDSSNKAGTPSTTLRITIVPIDIYTFYIEIPSFSKSRINYYLRRTKNISRK